MARVLIAARVTVPVAGEAEYLRVAGALATRLEARGQHLWVFRSRSDARLLLEFWEGPSVHEPGRPADPDEQALRDRLRGLVDYADADRIWDEVAWPERTED